MYAATLIGPMMANHGIAPVRLTPNRRKILESILYLIQEGEAAGARLTQYEIVKSLFLADMVHLERYGRPVTFDNYSALEFGPVPNEAYDMLKPDYAWESRIQQQPSAPWQRTRASGSTFHHHTVSRPPDLRLLSRSDVEALSYALQMVRELGFGRIRDWTHEHPAYVEAWEGRGTAKAKPMRYELLLPDEDQEEAEALAFASAHL